MKNVTFTSRQKLSRRTALRGLGASAALPWLDAMRPAFAKEASAESDAKGGDPTRFVSISLALGLIQENLNPKDAGTDYTASRYLEGLQDIRDEFSVLSQCHRPDVVGGHRAEASILSAAPISGSASFRNTISLDQYMAKHLGHETRIRSLVLNSGNTASPSYTQNGTMIPAQTSPRAVFEKLFVEEGAASRKATAQRLSEGRSIMDIISADAKLLQKNLGSGDREKLDQYFTSVRELEQRLEGYENWLNEPKPDIEAEFPTDIEDANRVVERHVMMLDVMALALQTDSTRFMTLHLDGGNRTINIPGVTQGYHALSHHGQDKKKLEELALIETQLVGAYGRFLRKLKGMKESSGSALDNTMVLMSSNLGNASSHRNTNVPVLFGGGGFRHGQHLALGTAQKQYPLTNLFLSALHRVGMMDDQFVSSTGTVTELA